jgi:hypothetical protein
VLVSQNTIVWVIYKQKLIFFSSGNWGVPDESIGSGESLLDASSVMERAEVKGEILSSHMAQEWKDKRASIFNKGINSFMKTEPSCSSHFLMSSLLIPPQWGPSFTMNFREDTFKP